MLHLFSSFFHWTDVVLIKSRYGSDWLILPFSSLLLSLLPYLLLLPSPFPSLSRPAPSPLPLNISFSPPFPSPTLSPPLPPYPPSPPSLPHSILRPFRKRLTCQAFLHSMVDEMVNDDFWDVPKVITIVLRRFCS